MNSVGNKVMAARKMMAAKGEGVYWQKTGDAETVNDCRSIG
jgi:hypothetical protein